MKTMRWTWAVLACWCLMVGAARAELRPADYQAVSQSELVSNRDAYKGKKVQVTGVFLFTGSDFCYQIRKTKINTRDYFCFALGSPSLVRLYLKKDHPQADQLLNLRKGTKVTAYGVFDYLGADYHYMVVDGFDVVTTP
ncbi:hypothetical protein [Deferrisoma camini]|uniref:hypothetical protein n=1 Tax=Deferrisoma camini TaxID=1035120 RepID=UPI00046CFDD3|nr:hypothetical protein [Deferrisoma camini]